MKSEILEFFGENAKDNARVLKKKDNEYVLAELRKLKWEKYAIDSEVSAEKLLFFMHSL
jgi:hypothetical protein